MKNKTLKLPKNRVEKFKNIIEYLVGQEEAPASLLDWIKKTLIYSSGMVITIEGNKKEVKELLDFLNKRYEK